MAQWLMQWTPVREYCIVLLLPEGLSSSRCILVFVYIQEFVSNILFGACLSKENHCETTKDKETYFQEQKHFIKIRWFCKLFCSRIFTSSYILVLKVFLFKSIWHLFQLFLKQFDSKWADSFWNEWRHFGVNWHMALYLVNCPSPSTKENISIVVAKYSWFFAFPFRSLFTLLFYAYFWL